MGLAAVILAANTIVAPAASAVDTTPPSAYELAAAGQHWTIPSAHGALRVWAPEPADGARAALVVYVHGYYIDVDRAWHEHALPEQFAASGVQAVFVACGAPEDSAERVGWTSLAALRATVAEATGLALPDATVAIAHGGGARTVRTWLGDPTLRGVILLDSAIVSPARFDRWVRLRDRLLVYVGPTSARRTLDGPGELGRLAGPTVHVHATASHGELVTGGTAIPKLLRAVGLPRR